MRNRSASARKRLIGILSRNALEELSSSSTPWHLDKKALLEDILQHWEKEEENVEYEINKLFSEAKSK